MKKDQLIGSGAFRAALLLKTAIALALVLGISALMFTGCDTGGGDDDDTPNWGKISDWTSDGDFVLGTATAEFSFSTDSRYKETALGNLIADGMAEYARNRAAKSGETVDFAFHNGMDLKATIPAGSVTNTTVSGTIGTDTLYLVTYTGAEIQTLFNIFVHSNSSGSWNGNCAVIVSKEVSYTVDNATPPNATDIKVNSVAINTTKKYRVAVGNFIAGPGDPDPSVTTGRNAFRNYGTDKFEAGLELKQAVAQYIYVQGTISPGTVGKRITGTVPKL
jgi:2',3'-cyclic-nucleotide 2'-phosphodiesterase (5'-nucleotidase family)